jgi:hypothetical protein
VKDIGQPTGCFQWGYIDRTGKLVIPATRVSPLEFSEGLAALAVNGKMGYIDTSNKFAIAAQFDEAFPFFDGVAEATLAKKPVLIDKTGKVLCALPTTYLHPGATHFSEGLSPFSAVVGGGSKYGFVDKACRVVIPAKFNGAQEFSDGLAAIQQGEKWGFIDKSGKLVISPQFEGPDEPFRGGLAQIIGDDGGYAYIDKSGKLLKPWAGPAPATAAPAPAPSPAATTPAPAPAPAVKPNPALAKQYFQRGEAAAWRYDYNTATASYKEAVRLAPDNDEYAYELGLQLCINGKYEEAILYYQKAIELKPQEILYHYNLAEAYAELGKATEAMREADTAVRLAPNNEYAIASRKRVIAKLKSKSGPN